MNNVIIPEIIPDVKNLKAILQRELPPGCIVWIPLLKRKTITIYKPFILFSEVYIKKDKIIVANTMAFYFVIALFFCIPLIFYLLFKMKDGDAFSSTVHKIVLRATTHK